MYIESKKMLIVIIVLSVLVLGLGGFIVYDKLFKEEEKTRTVINDVSVDLSSFYNVGYILEKVDKANNNENSTYYGYLYKNNKIKIKNLDPSAALFMSIDSNVDERIKQQQIAETKVKYDLEKMFTNELKYSANSITAGEKYSITYNSDSKTYTYSNQNEAVKRSEEFKTSNVSTELKESEITVRRKVYYVEYKANESGVYTTANIYKSSDKKSLVGTVSLKNGTINDTEVLAKYSSKFNTYIYTFIEEKQDEYRLYSVERVK